MTPVAHWIGEHFGGATSGGKPLDENWLDKRLAAAMGALAEHHRELLMLAVQGNIGAMDDEESRRLSAIQPGKPGFAREIEWAARQFPDQRKSIAYHYNQYMRLRKAMEWMRQEFLPLLTALRRGEAIGYSDLVNVVVMKDALDAVSFRNIARNISGAYEVTEADCGQFAMLLESLHRQIRIAVPQPRSRVPHPELGR